MAPRKKKRPPSRKAAPPPKPRRVVKRAARPPGAARAAVPDSPPQPAAPPARALHYKVVELSTVDEGTLERTVNEWCAQGWSLDVVQFAMRESSKRPSMAFVFFTREGAPAAHDADGARGRLRELSETGSPSARLLASPDFTGNAAAAAASPSAPASGTSSGASSSPSKAYRYARPPGMVSAHERLAQLAGLEGSERPERGLVLELGSEPDLVLLPGPGNNMEPVPGGPGWATGRESASEPVPGGEQEFEFDPGDGPESEP